MMHLSATPKYSNFTAGHKDGKLMCVENAQIRLKESFSQMKMFLHIFFIFFYNFDL